MRSSSDMPPMSEATPATLWDSGWLTTEADRSTAPSLLFPGCDLDQFLDLLEIPCLLLFNRKLDFKTFRELFYFKHLGIYSRKSSVCVFVWY